MVSYVFEDCVRDCIVKEFLEEYVMVHSIKGFNHVERYVYCAVWWSFLVEAGSDVISD